MKKNLVKIFISLMYAWGKIWYDKKYLTGKWFDRNHFSAGWKWIIKYWFGQKILGYNRRVKFPVHRNVQYSCPENLIFNVDDMDNIQNYGCYFQSIGAKLVFGKGIKIGPNCGFITANHDLNNLDVSTEGKDIIIGDNCWIGMNSIILPGVELQNHTIVGAGSVVTKSFEEENIVIAGNPARKIRNI